MALHERTPEEIAEIKEIFDEDELKHGCGYWSVCIDHACFCSMDAAVSQGFNIEVWDRLEKEYREEITAYREEMRQYDEEDDW